MLRTLLFAVMVTLGLAMIQNRSNFPTPIVVPVLTALLTKYTLGDWDTGFRWTSNDFWFVGSVLATSYVTLQSIKTFL